MTRAATLAALLGLTACTPEIPDATYVCTSTAECPPGLACDSVRGLCVREARFPDAGCTPLTCEIVRAECGALDDGCGGTLSCGTCTAPETCGGDGSPNICGCIPRVCEPGECGGPQNGCGAFLDCGGCDLPRRCNDVTDRCECDGGDPCVAPGACGSPLNGCGDVVACGDTCTDPTPDCGAMTPNVCGVGTCVPKTCAGEGANCGVISDGCTSTLNCGTCTAPETCGGGLAGTANRCGCSPRTCANTELAIECGDAREECGTMIYCGSCPSPGTTCVANRCVCAPLAEPNDDPSTATRVTVIGTRTVVMDQNIHVPTDQDFLVFQPEFRTLDGALNVTVSVPASHDLGVWVTCPDASTSEMLCAPGSRHDTSYSESGCVADGGGTSRTAVSFSVSCASPTFLARVAGTLSCPPYDVVIDLVPVV